MATMALGPSFASRDLASSEVRPFGELFSSANSAAIAPPSSFLGRPEPESACSEVAGFHINSVHPGNSRRLMRGLLIAFSISTALALGLQGDLSLLADRLQRSPSGRPRGRPPIERQRGSGSGGRAEFAIASVSEAIPRRFPPVGVIDARQPGAYRATRDILGAQNGPLNNGRANPSKFGCGLHQSRRPLRHGL